MKKSIILLVTTVLFFTECNDKSNEHSHGGESHDHGAGTHEHENGSVHEDHQDAEHHQEEFKVESDSSALKTPKEQMDSHEDDLHKH